MPPNYLVQHTFLGQPIMGGINPTMRDRLVAVESSLRQQVGKVTDDAFFTWCGLREPVGGWRERAGFHSSGSAIDVNAHCPS